MTNPFAPPDGARAPAPVPAPEPVPADAPLQALCVPALVCGVLAVPASLLLLAGVLLGSPELLSSGPLLGLLLSTAAVVLGTSGRRRARAKRLRGERLAVTGIVLGVGALLAAAAVAGLVAEDLETYADCLDASITFAADDACLEALQDALPS